MNYSVNKFSHCFSQHSAIAVSVLSVVRLWHACIPTIAAKLFYDCV